MHYDNHHFPEFLAGPPKPPTGPEVGPWYDRCAPGCDDQLAVFSRVGRGLKGSGYKVEVKYDDKGETYLEGMIEDPVTGEWTSDWVSGNINGGYLTYQYHMHSWTNPKTFTITFTYTRPERSECEWTFTTPPIPYFADDEITTAVDLDALAKVVGTTVERIQDILDDDFDPNDPSTWPLQIWDLRGKNILDLVLSLEDHIHKDLGFGGVSGSSDGFLEGCNGNTPGTRDTVRDYIDGVRYDILGKLGLWENQEPYITGHEEDDPQSYYRDSFVFQNNELNPYFWVNYQYLPNPYDEDYGRYGERVTSLKQWSDAKDNDLYAGLQQLANTVNTKEPSTSGNYVYQYAARKRNNENVDYVTLKGELSAHIRDIHQMIDNIMDLLIVLASHIPQNTPGNGVGYDLVIDSTHHTGQSGADKFAINGTIKPKA